MNERNIIEAKQYCRGIKRFFILNILLYGAMLCFLLTLVADMKAQIIVPIIVVLYFLLSEIFGRKEYLIILEQVKHDINNNLACEKVEHISECNIDQDYEKLNGKGGFNYFITAGRRYELTGQNGTKYKITKKPKMEFIFSEDTRVRLTYLQTSMVVTNIELLEQIDTVDSLKNSSEEEGSRF